MRDHRSRLLQPLVQIETRDRQFLAGISEVMTEAARLSGHWIACRPGCTECCLGPFAINQLDALRLRKGLALLDEYDLPRAERVRARAKAYIAAIAQEYPGDPATGALWDEEGLPASMESVYCPALDRDTGCCDLYEARPITCRTFGPATRTTAEVVSTCELCYAGATDEEISRCAVDVDREGMERELVGALERAGARGMTIIAFALGLDRFPIDADPNGDPVRR